MISHFIQNGSDDDSIAAEKADKNDAEEAKNVLKVVDEADEQQAAEEVASALAVDQLDIWRSWMLLERLKTLPSQQEADSDAKVSREAEGKDQRPPRQSSPAPPSLGGRAGRASADTGSMVGVAGSPGLGDKDGAIDPHGSVQGGAMEAGPDCVPAAAAAESDPARA